MDYWTSSILGSYILVPDRGFLVNNDLSDLTRWTQRGILRQSLMVLKVENVGEQLHWISLDETTHLHSAGTISKRNVFVVGVGANNGASSQCWWRVDYYRDDIWGDDRRFVAGFWCSASWVIEIDREVDCLMSLSFLSLSCAGLPTIIGF